MSEQTTDSKDFDWAAWIQDNPESRKRDANERMEAAQKEYSSHDLPILGDNVQARIIIDNIGSILVHPEGSAFEQFSDERPEIEQGQTKE